MKRVIALFYKGLDGPSNLLHTLNSTTSVVFVDKKGILTDTHRTIQEICLPRDIQANHSCDIPRSNPEDISMIYEKYVMRCFLLLLW
jgi:hypothetical protein